MPVKLRREEYAEQTRRAILDAATEAFVELGFERTSIDEIARRARVTKGAVYHHFESKSHLFLEVLRETNDELVRHIAQRATGDDPWQRALSSISAYFEMCLDDRFRRIVLEEGPVALGWERWRQFDEDYVIGNTRAMLEQLMALGVIRRQPADILARVLVAALSEAGMAIAAAPDRVAARKEAEAAMLALLSGLRLPAKR